MKLSAKKSIFSTLLFLLFCVNQNSFAQNSYENSNTPTQEEVSENDVKNDKVEDIIVKYDDTPTCALGKNRYDFSGPFISVGGKYSFVRNQTTAKYESYIYHAPPPAQQPPQPLPPNYREYTLDEASKQSYAASMNPSSFGLLLSFGLGSMFYKNWYTAIQFGYTFSFAQEKNGSDISLKHQDSGFDVRGRIGYQVFDETLVYLIAGVTRVMCNFKPNQHQEELGVSAYNKDDDRLKVSEYLPIFGAGIEQRVHKDWTVNFEFTLAVGKTTDPVQIAKADEAKNLHYMNRAHKLNANEMRFTVTRHL